jgi:hypothetical protein
VAYYCALSGSVCGFVDGNAVARAEVVIVSGLGVMKKLNGTNACYGSIAVSQRLSDLSGLVKRNFCCARRFDGWHNGELRARCNQ